MKRQKYSLSHYRLTTMDMGLLIPLTWFEALPGDSIQQATSALIRVSPLLAPVMHPVRVRIHHWFVPNRLIWEDWEDFITGGEDGLDSSVHPYILATGVSEGSLRHYLGVPQGGTWSPGLHINALPVRAYNLIYNKYYRDQDLVDEKTVSLASGQDTTTDSDLLYASWEKDYFTTARPWEQKGESIGIPVTGEADVTGIGAYNQTYAVSSQAVYETDGSNPTYASAKPIGETADNDKFYVEQGDTGYPNIKADLSTGATIDINDLRLALALQNFQEARARYGSRYVEYLRYLGVRSSDARLQNPEYLGGGRQIIQFSEVLAHDGSNTGSLYGHGIAAMRSNKYRRYFEEHGIVMTIMSVIPKTIYCQGLERKWSREVKEDYYTKELAHIGEQEVLNKEVYVDHSSPSGIHGYQSRYDEYRSIPSSITGEFISSLDHWHLARIFGGDTALNSTFVTANPTKRVLASPSTDALYVMAKHSIQARRIVVPRGQKGNLL